MHKTFAALVLVGFSVATLLAAACSGGSGGSSSAGKVCTPGSTQTCVGPGACVGGQSCRSDGTGYDACDCGNQPDVGPPDVGASFDSSLADSVDDAFDSTTTWDSESSAAADSEASSSGDSQPTHGEDGSGSSSGGSSSSSGASGSSSSGSSSSSSGSSSSSSSGSTGACTPVASVPSTEIPPYVPVVRIANACSAAQISGFVTACTSPTGSSSTCNAFAMNAANAGCLACVYGAADGGTSSTGGVLLNSMGTAIEFNIPGCLALADPTNGPACAAALEPTLQCLVQACNTMACQVNPTEEPACETAAQSGACSSEVQSEQTPCAVDGADGGVFATSCDTPTGILATICGM